MNRNRSNNYTEGRILDLLKNNNILKNEFYGLYGISYSGKPIFKNVISVEEGNLLLDRGKRLNVHMRDIKSDLKKGRFYKFVIDERVLYYDTSTYVIIDTRKDYSMLDYNPYQEFIRRRFERLNNPEANKMIANLMREIGKGMYSSKQRMIFELLQNADDAPSGDTLQFHVDVKGDYLLIMHDGVPFNRNDVEAITSAAESTKRNDKKKTGYKGIGFKSVFTDSEEVLIESGGYSFAFQRHNNYFKSFDEFYFSSKRYNENPRFVEEDKELYKKQRNEFNPNTDIPWQVIPVWENGISEKLNDTNFEKFNNNVKIAINFGKENVFSYINAIGDFVSIPQFILFLRNVNYFRSPKNGITVTKKSIGADIVKIEKRTFNLKTRKNKKIQLTYLIKNLSEISINDDAFAAAGIDLVRVESENELGYKLYSFENTKGKTLEEVPSKLASIDSTQITFAIPVIDGSIGAEERYLKNIDFSSLYTFLPMEEKRFRLPFLVNADFVPSSDREKIQGSNPWNIFLMSKVAEQHVALLEKFSHCFVGDNKFYHNYLSLLLDRLIADDNTAQEIIDKYNSIYRDNLLKAKIIVSDDNQVVTLGKTIVDESGITKIFDNEMFYDIVNTNKKLPNINLKSDYLSYKYLGIEVINLRTLISKIGRDNYQLFAKLVSKLTDHKYTELLYWLDKVAEHSNYKENTIGNIPFINHDSNVYSINELINISNVWVVDSNTKQIEGVLKDLEYDIINLELNKHHNIDAYLKLSNNYTNKPELAYKRISDNILLSKLSPYNKIELINYFEGSTFMKGIGRSKYISNLKMFLNNENHAYPLNELIAPSDDVINSSFYGFAIANREYNLLDIRFRKEVIHDDMLFKMFLLNESLNAQWSKQFSISNIGYYVAEVEFWFDKVVDKDSISTSEWENIPWLYINDTIRFAKNEKTYCPPSLYDLPQEKYTIVDSIISGSLMLPNYESSVLINYLGLKLNSEKISNYIIEHNNITLRDANIFLDWLEENDENEFFNNWTFNKINEDSYSLVENTKLIYDSSNKINYYIQNNEGLSIKFIPLPEELCSKNRNKIGLLEDKLLLAIIHTNEFDQDLGKYFHDDLSYDDLELFINNLNKFNLNSSLSHDQDTPEHNIVTLLLSYLEDDKFASHYHHDIDSLIDVFRSNILIDKVPLSENNKVDKISFRIDNVEYDKLKLSDVIKSFKGESNVLSDVIESFSDIKQKNQLREKIFKTEEMKHKEIYDQLKTDTTFLDPFQTVFALLFKNENMVKHEKTHEFPNIFFDDYYRSHVDNISIYNGYKTFLDIIYNLDFYSFNMDDDFYFYDTDFKNLVYHEASVESEKPPQWVQDWIDVNETDKRVGFLSKLGFNINDSDIVNYRKAMVTEPFDLDIVSKYYASVKLNKTLLWNTISWLSKYSSDKITNNITFILKTLQDVDFREIDGLLLPVIDGIYDKISYKIVEIEENEELHLMSEYWREWRKRIFNLLQNKGKYIIDYTLPKMIEHHLKIINVPPKLELDGRLLESNSTRFDELYYKKWEFYDDIKIYIYNGEELPQVVIYDSFEVVNITQDKSCRHKDSYYITMDLEDIILKKLSSDFPKDKLTKLSDWEYKTRNDETLLHKPSYDYNESFERMISDRHGLNKEAQKDKNNEAYVATLYYLENQGYDLSDSTKSDGKIIQIKSSESDNIECIIRSAIGGLLYINQYHWEELKKEEVLLSVMYPGGEPHIFSTRQELLDNKLNIYLLFRLINPKNPDKVDNIFDQLNKNDSHLMLITSQKMMESLFPNMDNKVITNVAIEDDSFNVKF